METGPTEVFERIRELRRQSRFDEAIVLCQSLNPGNFEQQSVVELNLARIYLSMGDRKAGKFHLLRALDFDFQNRAALFTLIRYLVREKEYDDCINICDQLLAVDERSSDFAFTETAIKYRGFCYYKSGRISQAKQDLSQTQFSPKEPVIGSNDTFFDIAKRLGIDK